MSLHVFGRPKVWTRVRTSEDDKLDEEVANL